MITPRTLESGPLLEALIRLLNDNKEETNLQCHQVSLPLVYSTLCSFICIDSWEAL
jgi:hypothetical protein